MSKLNIMLMGDPHAEPDQSLNRFHIAGRFMQEKQPDYVWCAGDWGSFNSLSPHEIGTIHNEGKRYTKDIDACNHALDIFHHYYKGMKKKPTLVISEGNHEQWIQRAVVKQPHLWGHVSLGDIKFAKYQWKLIPFLQPVKIGGITFKHYFTSGVMGRPISGETQAWNMLRKVHMSCVAGHLHEFHYHETINGAGEKLLGLNVGCFLDQIPHYTLESKRWWSGLIMLREVVKGYGSLAKYDMQYLRRNYG